MVSVREELHKLWTQYRKSKSLKIRNRLVEHYMPLVSRLAEIMARRLWPRVTADELASAGFEGLISAVTTFDPSRGVKFETFCRQRIVGAIRDWQREVDPLGRSGRNFERSLNHIEERAQAETGRSPAPDDSAKRMGLTLAKFLKMKKTVIASHCVSLETPGDRGDDTRVRGLAPADRGPSPVDHTERELIREIIVRGLKEQDRLIITLYYYERLTMAEIGTVLGVSESRVCQRHAEIVEQLRTRLAASACDLVA
jgi:RNA polymerase sigma factor for flagellar operon FliA